MEDNLTRLHKVNKEKLVEINKELYVLGPEREVLVEKSSFVPVYFAVVRTGEILHDTPVPGCMSTGDTNKNVYGPFLSLKKAEDVKEEKQKIDRVRYGISGEIQTIVIPEDVFPESGEIQYYKYYHASYHLRGDQQLYTGKPTTPEQFSEFIRIMLEKIKKASEKSVESGRNLKAIVDGCFIEVSYRHESGFPMLDYCIDSFGPTNLDIRRFSRVYLGWDKREELDLNDSVTFHQLKERWHSSEYVSLSPIEISLKHNSVGAIIEKGKLI